ncbi:exodeoxyribonuclease VII large subunit [Candidatus Saccharibacteria bacterium]|nr:MAG: exodeoxyribonuclease VII large subunit [Candidatus Saccharibacteria bacterium]
MSDVPLFGVSEFVAVVNQTLEYAYPVVQVEGEVSGLRFSQQKYVFFDLKDEQGTINCFMMVWQLRTPIEDGMRVVVSAQPKLLAWGKFSLTVQSVQPSGEGSLKKSFELLRAKLDREGLFAAERKRPLPATPRRVAVISSLQAAGYADFIKILNTRWGGLDIHVADTRVQGSEAADQMIAALRYFNSCSQLADVLVIVRGGGSADDLAVFNDELLVREIAGSRIPTVVGVGHEVDRTLSEMAADVRAATPSNAAQLLVPDRQEIIASMQQSLRTMATRSQQAIDTARQQLQQQLSDAAEHAHTKIVQMCREVEQARTLLRAHDPRNVLAKGYAIVHGEIAKGSMIEIEMHKQQLQAEVRDVKTAKNY